MPAHELLSGLKRAARHGVVAGGAVHDPFRFCRNHIVCGVHARRMTRQIHESGRQETVRFDPAREIHRIHVVRHRQHFRLIVAFAPVEPGPAAFAPDRQAAVVAQRRDIRDTA